jgi:hypothetical protein
MSKRKRSKASTGITTARRVTSTDITANPPLAPLSPPSTTSSGLGGRLVLFAIAVLVLVTAWLAYANAQRVWPFASGDDDASSKWSGLRGHGLSPWGSSGMEGGRGSRGSERSGWSSKNPRTQDDLWREVFSGRLGKRNDWKPEKWQPVTPDDAVIDRFVALHRKGDPAAQKLLAPLVAADEVAADDAAFERRATDQFLRDPGLHIVDVWKGDPDADGRPRPVAGRYILVTKGSSASVMVPMRTRSGGSLPQRLQLTHPDLVVEVKGGVIHGVRSELHKGP